MNKKIAMSATSIFAALAVMGGVTFAAFTSQATIVGNTFASGEASLVISTTDETTGFDETATGFSGGNFVPGQTENFSFWLRNDGDVELNAIAKIVKVTSTSADPELLQDSMTVTFECTGNPAAGPFTINQWEAGQAAVGNIPTGESPVACDMEVSMPISADNSVAGKDVQFDVQFNATQVVAP